jgi:hypothetical protein
LLQIAVLQRQFLVETHLFSFTRLEEIKASSNHLKHVPTSFFNIKCLRHLELVNNEIISLLNCDVSEQFDMDDVIPDAVTWQCHSLKSLNLARNQLKSIPSAIHAANSLEKLQLFGNKITSFPMGWKCPLVSENFVYLKLSLLKFLLCFLLLVHICILPLCRLLARVLKEGVQFWYNDTSTVKGGVGLRKRSSGKPLNFTLLHVSICSKLVRNFSNTTWLCEFVPLCFFT